MGRRSKFFGKHPREKKTVNVSKTKRRRHYYKNRKLLKKYYLRSS